MPDQLERPLAEPLDPEQIRALCGDLLDRTVSAIVETGATLADLETAVAWAEGRDDAMADAREPLTGVAAAVYDLLAEQYDLFEED